MKDNMSDILKILKDLEDRLWKEYGNPLENYQKTQHDIHMTYYVSKLMQERGHEWISPINVEGKTEHCAYYSEKALYDAFLAGQLLAKADNKEMRASLLSELRQEILGVLAEIE